MARKSKSVMIRIGTNFNNEIECIKKARLNRGLDIKKSSTRLLTELLIKHNFWSQIKNELINLEIGEGRNET